MVILFVCRYILNIDCNHKFELTKKSFTILIRLQVKITLEDKTSKQQSLTILLYARDPWRHHWQGRVGKEINACDIAAHCPCSWRCTRVISSIIV